MPASYLPGTEGPASQPEWWTDDANVVQAARALYASDDIDVDEDATVSRGAELGAYVQAWVWVPFGSGD